MKKRIVLSEHIAYFVRSEPKKEFDYIKLKTFKE